MYYVDIHKKSTNTTQPNKRNGIIIGIILCSLIIIGILGSYAFFQAVGSNNANEEVNVQTGNLALTFADENNSITEALEFGGSIEKTFSIQNTGSLDAIARIMWDDLVNTYINGSLTYTLSSSDTETGTYTSLVENQNVPVSTASTKELLAGNLTVPSNSTKYYKLTITLNYLDDVDQTADLKASLSTHFSVEESDGKDLLLSGPVGQTMRKLGKIIKQTKPNFAEPATTDETKDGLFSMEDDYGTSYYYRGAVEDNYVKFGTWKESTYIGSESSSSPNTKEYLTLEECKSAITYNYNCRVTTSKVGKPMYWRIIRINGDGSVRMIYDGTEPHVNTDRTTDKFILRGNVVWNFTNHKDVKYVGYMYGGENGKSSTKRINLGEGGYYDSENAIFNETDSNIKNVIETWYSSNLIDLDTNIADVIYCNDRSLSNTPGEWFSWEGENRGYGANNTGFGSASRFLTETGDWNTTNSKPILKCPNKNDSFTKMDTDKGNGKLKQKIGLITVDEMSIAGVTYASNQNCYLFKTNGRYWTMSPSIFLTVNSNPASSIFNFNGSIDTVKPTVGASVAPVISLTPEYFATLTGDGTMTNPFREIGLEP